jgi:small subunit ribosomal protein S2
LASFDPSKILAVAVRQYAQKSIIKLAELTGIIAMPGRFLPGTLTNPLSDNFSEPDIILINDPVGDRQALKEAVKVGIPVIALCDTNNEIKYIDWVIPVNNKGRKSLALVYWLLTREILKHRGKIKEGEGFTVTAEEFEAEL